MDKNKIRALKVLYVEDEATLQQSTKNFLDRFFDNIDVADNGEEGLKLFKENRYDVVLTDIKMPKMSGDEMLKEIQSLDQNVFIVVLTAFDSCNNLDDLNVGYDVFLRKPIQFDEFVQAMNQLIQKNQI